jgi:hypothetical protein
VIESPALERSRADQIVRGATEDEQPIDLLQPAQLRLAQRAGLLQAPESLLHEPSTAETEEGIAGLATSSAIQVAAALVLIPQTLRLLRLAHITTPDFDF